MIYACVTRYTTQPGTLDALLGKVEGELVRLTPHQPGFRTATLIRTGPDECFFVTSWANEDATRHAGEQLVACTRQEMGPSLVDADSEIGAVTATHRDPAQRARYVGISFWELKPGKLAALTPLLREEYVPIVAQRQGFARYAIVQTGADHVIVFVVYGTKADADLPPSPASNRW